MKSNDLDDFCGIKVRKGSFGEQDRTVVREVVFRDDYRLDARHLMPQRQSFVIDIGAHIVTFAKMWHLRNPAAKIVCVEVCPENWGVLEVNAALIATVERAACTYDIGPVELLNSVMDGGTATGGSILTSSVSDHTDGYWKDTRPITKVTLESLMQKHGFPRIDCLKLDCEGSEFSILENTLSLSKVGFICGEYHGEERWKELVARKFSDWDYCHLGASLFHLQNPRWTEDFLPSGE